MVPKYVKLFNKLTQSPKPSPSPNDYLVEAGLNEEDLQGITASLDVDASTLSKKQKQLLTADEGAGLKPSTSNFTGLEIISCTSSAITILTTLVSLEKWVGSRIFVTITLNNVKHRVPVNQAIKLLLDTAKNRQA